MTAAPDLIQKIPLREIGRTFLTLGLLGFGGPPAHLGLMERELVTRRGWVPRQYFLDMLAAINLVPGPNSTEMAIHLGYALGGVPGMLLAGAGFIIPAVVFSLILAVIYVSAGSVPAVQGLLIGVKPVILVLILSAAYRLAKTGITNRILVGLLLAVFGIVLPGLPFVASALRFTPLVVPELLILVTCGAVYMLARRRQIVTQTALFALPNLATLIAQAQAAGPTLFDMFWRFFVIGGTLFGSGLVLASYLQRAFVDSFGWLRPQQLLDALVIGQSTPGPVLSTVAAAGYIMSTNFAPGDTLRGVLFGAVAALGVFLPSFIVILILGRVVPRLRRSPAAMDFLKGVNAGVIALLFGTFLNLAWNTLVRPNGAGVDWLTLALTAVFFAASERFKWTALRLVIVGALIGLLRIVLQLV